MFMHAIVEGLQYNGSMPCIIPDLAKLDLALSKPILTIESRKSLGIDVTPFAPRRKLHAPLLDEGIKWSWSMLLSNESFKQAFWLRRARKDDVLSWIKLFDPRLLVGALKLLIDHGRAVRYWRKEAERCPRPNPSIG